MKNPKPQLGSHSPGPRDPELSHLLLSTTSPCHLGRWSSSLVLCGPQQSPRRSSLMHPASTSLCSGETCLPGKPPCSLHSHCYPPHRQALLGCWGMTGNQQTSVLPGEFPLKMGRKTLARYNILVTNCDRFSRGKLQGAMGAYTGGAGLCRIQYLSWGWAGVLAPGSGVSV